MRREITPKSRGISGTAQKSALFFIADMAIGGIKKDLTSRSLFKNFGNLCKQLADFELLRTAVLAHTASDAVGRLA